MTLAGSTGCFTNPSLVFSLGKANGCFRGPFEMGSVGGGQNAGAGGGTVEIRTSRFLHLDGNIASLGGSANGSDSGGGSGGSVYIITQNFSGHGGVDVTGGDGFGHGCGGAGGRIAIHVLWFREYSGDILAYGGLAGKDSKAGTTKNGAAGTIYTTDSNSVGLDAKELKFVNGEPVYKDGFVKLIIDNDNRNHVLGTLIMSEMNNGSCSFEFDEIEAQNHAVLWLEDGCTLTVHHFDGDRTGYMHLKSGQKLYAEYEPSKSGYTVAPVSYKIENGSEVILPSTTILLGTRTELHGKITNVQNLTVADGANAVFFSTSQTALLQDGIYIQETKPGNISFNWLTIQAGSEVNFTETESDLVLDLININLKYKSKVNMNKGTIYSDTAVVESLSILNIDFMGEAGESGFGAGGSLNQNGFGGAHGGNGGAPYPHVGGKPYDSVYEPQHAGSGGGHGDGEGGYGGGYLRWINGLNLWIDGEVTLEGQAGQKGNGGGGSGGGIWITTLNFTGFGHIDCHGGAGVGNGGGGSGGRISVHINFANKYRGRLNVVGGLGPGDLPSGAAGTVYLQENARGPQYADYKYDNDTGSLEETAEHRRIEIDNKDIDKHLYANHAEPWLYTLLFENKDQYSFDEADLRGHSNLKIGYPVGKETGNGMVVTVEIQKFYGDRTGAFKLQDRQELYVTYIESISNETTAPCSFLIDKGSEIFLPATTNIMGTRTVFAGKITGVETLLIRGGADILFKSSVSTALQENRKYITETEPGNVAFSILKVMALSRAEFRNMTNICSVSVSEFYVKYRGLLLLNYMKINSSYAHIESQGKLNMDGVGFQAEEGPGAGYTSKDGIGYGAGHGGYGGGFPSAHIGQPYNSIYSPLQSGSGGGNGEGTGGSGGGYLEWLNADLIEINGLLTASGTDGKGKNAAGGSGGSLLISSTNVTGHGTLSIHGGTGVGKGGGGSGGRVAINCRFRYSYGGKIENYGGFGKGEYKSKHSGASGTSFREENMRELEYRHKKYDPVHNTTYLDVDHHAIHSDNQMRKSPAPTVIQHEYETKYEFEELEILGTSWLWIDNKSVSVNLTAHKILGDKSGIFEVRKNQMVFIEFVESVTNITEAPCNYIVQEKSNIVFPSEVHIHGTSAIFKGNVIGVHNLYIEGEGTGQFFNSSSTALLENDEIVNQTDPGSFMWDQLHVKKGGEMSFEKSLCITASEIKVKYQGNLYMTDAAISTTYSWIESGGVFHLNGKGYAAEQGPGAGQTIKSEGYGASHGGYGGGANSTYSTTPYGSIFSPGVPGSGGGNGGGIGGAGGGVLYWNTSHYFELHGLLAIQGLDGSSTNAGGGSGGSLLIEAMNFTGHGVINSAGGSGSGTGGGGAGGRVAIHCSFRYSYGGKLINHGGVGGNSDKYKSHGGAAGTTFVKNNKRPLEYRILKYRPDSNITYFDVDHR